MSAPFEKFRVDELLLGWGRFKVRVWPMAPVFSVWLEENKARHKEVKKFIEDAIREKLEREAQP